VGQQPTLIWKASNVCRHEIEKPDLTRCRGSYLTRYYRQIAAHSSRGQAIANYERIILIVGLILILIIIPNMYWRLKIWLLRRRDFVSESEFLRDNNLRRDHISDAMKGGPRLRLKWVKGEYYIDRDSAKIILSQLSQLAV
jgi:hypothetical protein